MGIRMVSEQTGLSVDTLRWCERRELLSAAAAAAAAAAPTAGAGIPATPWRPSRSFMCCGVRRSYGRSVPMCTAAQSMTGLNGSSFDGRGPYTLRSAGHAEVNACRTVR